MPRFYYLCSMIEFKEIPEWWAVCAQTGCPRSGDCLRHQAFRKIPDGVKTWPCVLSRAMKDGECPCYVKPERLKMARGFTNISNKVRVRATRKAIRLRITEYLGSKGSYYRYRDGERLLSPEQQQWILRLLESYGCPTEDFFTQYIEVFDFQRLP